MKKLIIALAFLCLPALTWAQVIPRMEFYHGKECPHCHKQHKWLPELEALYPDLEVEIYEVWHNADNKKRLDQRLAEIGKESNAVPTNIIEQDVIVGFNPEAILETLEKYYGPPSGKVMEKNDKPQDLQSEDEKKAGFFQKIINWFKNLFS